MSLQRVAAIATIVAVGGGLAAGFAAIGPPGHARMVALDQRRVDDLIDIGRRLREGGGPLPASFTTGPGISRDPATGAPYAYLKESETRYRVCATFATAAGAGESIPGWGHPAGPACFRLARDDVTPIGGAFVPSPAEIR